MTNDDYAIRTENLTKRYGRGVLALDDVSIKIGHGEIVGYLGPNGAGKTTTIKILTNLLRPTSGHAYINGIDANKRPKETLCHVGALIEVPGVYDYLTPRDTLTYFGKVHGMAPRDIENRISEVLRLVKLSEWENKRIGAFSTGMQRRFGIAKAIFHTPDILILDEPVLGLDPKGMRDVRHMIKDFQKEGMTIFLSSHLLEEVSLTADSVIFLESGKVVDKDSVENVVARVQSTRITVQFLRPLPEADLARVQAIEAISDLGPKNGGIEFSFDGSPETSARILAEMMVMGLQVTAFQPERGTLEDFYVSIMNDEGVR
jgi:ABC-2 type transport system ATP-binding protein